MAHPASSVPGVLWIASCGPRWIRRDPPIAATCRSSRPAWIFASVGWRTNCAPAFCPCRDTVRHRLRQNGHFWTPELVIDRFSLNHAATLQPRSVYLVPLVESLSFRAGCGVAATPRAPPGVSTSSRASSPTARRASTRSSPGITGPCTSRSLPSRFPSASRPDLAEPAPACPRPPALSDDALRALASEPRAPLPMTTSPCPPRGRSAGRSA